MLRRKAFTFVELLIVITIIGVLSAVAFPQFRKTSARIELDNFAKNIYYLALYAQGSAVSGGKVYCLNLLPEEGKIWLTYKEVDSFINIQGRFAKVYKAKEGTKISSLKTEVYFYPDGSCDDFEVIFEDRFKMKLSLVSSGGVGEIKIQ